MRRSERHINESGYKGDIEKDRRYTELEMWTVRRRGDWDYIRAWGRGQLGQTLLEAARSRSCQGETCKGLSGGQLRAGWLV
jgi:hypothetical protein